MERSIQVGVQYSPYVEPKEPLLNGLVFYVINLIYIRDFLGHVDLKTTEIYARADTEMKRKAIENAYPDLIDPNLPDWNKDQALLSWLAEIKQLGHYAK